MNKDVLNPSSTAPVLVGIDGSEIALRALDRALAEARARNVPVRLVSAYPVAIVGDPGLEARFREAVTQECESNLMAAVEHARETASDVELDTITAEGDAARAVLRAARDACLVVMGKRGRGGALRGRLGSVSAAVAAHSPVPVVVVPPGEHQDGADQEQARTEARQAQDVQLTDGQGSGERRALASETDFSGTVVVGVDAAGDENPAVAQAIEYATAHGLGLSLVSVNGALSGTPEWFQDQYNQTYYFEESLKKLSELARSIAQRAPEVRVADHAFLGRPGRVLVQATRTADLVVVGSRGIGGFTGLLLGSVSQAVLAGAAGPVMVVPSGR
ncbi:universal stress protein [Kocuria tytonis]|uniref:Universal stress protein n=1 Tax=Kocuria tytonis TaxID=2054280 RepID=A0A495A5J3_9MICC|nr:universal stress protein [Kocuria tytonis]RKQ35098.1 universal stress protein [Kocuria tytonis]